MLAAFALLMTIAAVVTTASETITNNTPNLVVTLCFIARSPSYRASVVRLTKSPGNRNREIENMPESGQSDVCLTREPIVVSVQTNELACDEIGRASCRE